MTVGHNNGVLGSGSLGEELAHQILGVFVSKDPSLVKGEKSEKVSFEGLHWNRLREKARGCSKHLPTRALDVSSGGAKRQRQGKAMMVRAVCEGTSLADEKQAWPTRNKLGYEKTSLALQWTALVRCVLF
ncbi:hypothetical protein LWI28_012047 [Acer negundo]|uniref:Uncharacterized protein n=1 Tax=Acer negundo TaxID=4023 RepID=A0AAD5P1S1_ACENE|nr:hypothetical protein LWI28_012047 [Acer negundo]